MELLPIFYCLQRDFGSHSCSSSVKMKRAREPSVVVFQEPGRTKNKGSVKKRKFSGQNNSLSSSESFGKSSINFKEIAKEVREFGATGFTKREQRKFQQQKSQALGAKAPKKQKTPYPILMKAKKIRDQRATEQEELEKAMGIFKKKKAQNSKKDLPISVGRWVDHSKGLDAGKFKKGVHTLQQKDIAKFKKRKK